MDYKRIYNQLMERAKTRSAPEGYTERHHVIMKSHGGPDTSDNIVVLTAREHFIAHWLLWRVHRSPEMAHAFNFMKANPNDTSERNYYNSYGYAEASKAHAEAVSKLMKGNTHTLGKKLGPQSAERRAKISAAKRGKTHSEETRKLIGEKGKGRKHTEEWKRNASERMRKNNPYKGKTHSPEIRAKISAIVKERYANGHTPHNKGVPLDEEIKRRISETMTGVKQKQSTCPYCGKTGGSRAMKRYHFDNCKQKAA